MNVAFSVTSGAAFAVATTAKTLLYLKAGSTNPAVISAFGISFDGVTASAVPALVEMCSSTGATAGTAGSIGTVKMIKGYPSYTPISTATGQYSAEPGTLTSIAQWHVPAFMGSMVIQWPLGREPTLQITSATDMLAVSFRVSAPAAVNAVAYIIWEE